MQSKKMFINIFKRQYENLTRQENLTFLQEYILRLMVFIQKIVFKPQAAKYNLIPAILKKLHTK